ncbi:MAG TPA: sulfite exporter TauE/SafE family protein [Burkholderiaceae bacterium]|jgi:sulfite exporter TauE/SafE|nr:sulfite exporter TauE/SafE family protein [Burkholderiaceae bacterium]
MTAGILFSAFVMALLGGVHCAAMCGGVAVLAEDRMALPLRHARPGQLWLEQWVMHLGRLTTYALLGGLLGAVGMLVWQQSWLPVQRWLFAAGSFWMIGYGLLLMLPGTRDRTGWAGRMGLWLGRLVRTLPGHATFGRWLAGRPVLQRYVAGLGWGLIPCGMVYGALALALLAGNPLGSALVMLAFGAGTLPNLLLLSGGAGWLRHWVRRPAVRSTLALAVTGFGLLGLYRAVHLPDALLAQGFCVTF